jgi:LytS/YehU family sensor histidine kinase
LLRQYLGIEQIRFGSRLTVVEQLPHALDRALVPPLLLQPLVENAVKHGVAGLIDGGAIAIEAREQAGGLVLSVENPYDEDRPNASSTRVGLQNVKRRLDTEFGPAASLRTTESHGTYRAEIRLPLRLAIDQAGQEVAAMPSAVSR